MPSAWKANILWITLNAKNKRGDKNNQSSLAHSWTFDIHELFVDGLRTALPEVNPN
ncbi:MAG: hypothetical protein R2796_04330 [Chitinophagaceae bacterium]